jgi:hypothetical protein
MTNESIVPNQKGTTTVTDNKNYGKNESEIPMSAEMKILTENGVWYKTGKELEDAIFKSMHDWAIRVIEEEFKIKRGERIQS